MWRLSATLRLAGLVFYALGLAALWTLWGVLILVGAVFAASFRLLGVPGVGFERVVAAHRHSWRSAVGVVPGLRAAKARAVLVPQPLQGDAANGRSSDAS